MKINLFELIIVVMSTIAFVTGLVDSLNVQIPKGHRLVSLVCAVVSFLIGTYVMNGKF